MTWKDSSRVLSFLRPGCPEGKGLVSNQSSVMRSALQCTREIHLLDCNFLSVFYYLKYNYFFIFPLKCNLLVKASLESSHHIFNMTRFSLSDHLLWCDIPHHWWQMLFWTTSASYRHGTYIFVFETPQCLAKQYACI